MGDLRKPELSDLIRENLSGPGPRRCLHGGECTAPKALDHFADDANQVYQALKSVVPVLERFATDENVQVDVRQVATFWSGVATSACEYYEQGSDDFEWWFEPALKGPGGRWRPISELHQDMLKQHYEMLRQIPSGTEQTRMKAGRGRSYLDYVRVAKHIADTDPSTGPALERWLDRLTFWQDTVSRNDWAKDNPPPLSADDAERLTHEYDINKAKVLIDAAAREAWKPNQETNPDDAEPADE